MKTRVTKADLEKQLKELKTQLTKTTRENEYLTRKLNRQTGHWEYLYTAVDMTEDYYDDLIRRTSLVRENTFYNMLEDNSIEVSQIRDFSDGNRVTILISYDKSKHTKMMRATFFKKVGIKK